MHYASEYDSSNSMDRRNHSHIQFPQFLNFCDFVRHHLIRIFFFQECNAFIASRFLGTSYGF